MSNRIVRKLFNVEATGTIVKMRDLIPGDLFTLDDEDEIHGYENGTKVYIAKSNPVLLDDGIMSIEGELLFSKNLHIRE